MFEDSLKKIIICVFLTGFASSAIAKQTSRDLPAFTCENYYLKLEQTANSFKVMSLNSFQQFKTDNPPLFEKVTGINWVNIYGISIGADALADRCFHLTKDDSIFSCVPKSKIDLLGKNGEVIATLEAFKDGVGSLGVSIDSTLHGFYLKIEPSDRSDPSSKVSLYGFGGGFFTLKFERGDDCQ